MKVYPYLLRIWRSSERITLGRRHHRFVDAPRLCLSGGPSWTGSAREMLAFRLSNALTTDFWVQEQGAQFMPA
jgi:hypothetical protein